MNRWNSLSQMIEHSMKHATCTCSFVNIPDIDIHKIKMDLLNLNELKCPLITTKCTATGENIHFGTILKKKHRFQNFICEGNVRII